MTVSQIYKLQQYAEMQGLNPVAFPQTFSSYITDDVATVEGTAVIVDERSANFPPIIIRLAIQNLGGFVCAKAAATSSGKSCPA